MAPLSVDAFRARYGVWLAGGLAMMFVAFLGGALIYAEVTDITTALAGVGTAHPRWAAAAPDQVTYRPPRGRSFLEAVTEQNAAAGGAEMRRVSLPDGGGATAAVELQVGGRRVYAYLRYQRHDGQRVNAYVGEAPGKARAERLRVAWQLAHHKGLLSPIA